MVNILIFISDQIQSWKILCLEQISFIRISNEQISHAVLSFISDFVIENDFHYSLILVLHFPSTVCSDIYRSNSYFFFFSSRKPLPNLHEVFLILISCNHIPAYDNRVISLLYRMSGGGKSFSIVVRERSKKFHR